MKRRTIHCSGHLVLRLGLSNGQRDSKFPSIPQDQQLTVEQLAAVNDAIKACKIVSGVLNPPPTPLMCLSMCIQQIQSWF